MLLPENQRITCRLSVLLLVLGLVGCNTDQISKSITVAQLRQAYQANEDFFFLDVRTIVEYRAGHLEFTDSRIPYDSLRHNLNLLPDDKNQTIFCFCRSGQRSAIATEFLTSQGYKKVSNVVGGILAWQQAGYPIVSGNP